MRRLITTFLLLFCLMTGTYAAAGDYGLRIVIDSYKAVNRTGMHLTADAPIALKDQTELRFHLLLRHEMPYGNLVQVKLNDGRKIACVIPSDNMDKPHIGLICGDKLQSSSTGLPYGEAMEASVVFDKRAGSVTFKLNGITVKQDIDLQGADEMDIRFGSLPDLAEMHDAVPADLWDVKVFYGERLAYHWELRQHDGADCYDLIAHHRATTSNAHWLLDDHIKMRRIYHWEGQGLTQATFDEKDNLFYITDGKVMRTVNPADGKVSEQKITRGYRAMNYSNHLMSEPATGDLYSYDLYTGAFSKYNKVSGTFSADTATAEMPRFHNHTLSFADSLTAYAFGGYGFFRYNNDLFRITPAKGKVERLKYSPAIPPRTSAASCVVGDKLYIFGGTGNESGKQELKVRNYYDLYCIDLKTLKSQLVWKAETPKEDFIMTSQMYYNEADRSFYVGLAGPQGTIMRLMLDEPKWTFVTEVVKNKFLHRDFTYDLYRSDSLGKMFLLIDQHLDGQTHEINIYSVDLPLMDNLQIAQTETKEKSGSRWWLWTLLALAILGAVAAALIVRKKRQARPVTKAVAEAPAVEAVAAGEEASPTAEEQQEAAEGETPEDAPLEFRPAAILKPELPKENFVRVLGVFEVYDKEGTDVTSQFSMRLRDLLVMLLLQSEKNGRGIHKDKLDETLWEGMDQKAARSNRQVNVSKLRSMLRQLTDMEIVTDKVYYRIETGATKFDYHEVMALIKDIHNGEEVTDEQLALLLQDPMLPTMSYEWLDDFKANYSDAVIRLLVPMMESRLSRGDNEVAQQMAEAVLRHDPFNEEALRVQCQVLCRRKAVGVAKSFYEKFCRNYQSAMGEPFDKSFAEISAIS